MQSLYLYAIEWDTDEEEDTFSLPDYVATDKEADGTELADKLSDQYGWCVNSITPIEVIPFISTL